MAATPKDGQLYAYDIDSNKRLYATPITRREMSTWLSSKPVHFCPGSSGGAEWSGPAYSPDTNLIYGAELVHHCGGDRSGQARERVARAAMDR